MKKYTFFILIFAFAAMFTSCKENDTTKPKIFFSGETETSQRWVLQEYYTLPTATASDNTDGDITSSIVVSHDLTFYRTRDDFVPGSFVYELTDKLKTGMEGYVGRDGEYTITYSATDAAGNKGTKTISVSVKNSLINWTKTASGTDIEYQMKREKLEGNQDIGGIYTKDASGVVIDQTAEFGFEGVGGKPVEVKIKADRKYNYRIGFSKFAVITGCGVSIDFNRFNDEIDIPRQSVLASEDVMGEQEKTEFLYIITQNGNCTYGSFQFVIEYQIERYREVTATDIYDYVFPDTPGDERYWYYDNRKATYKETYIKK